MATDDNFFQPLHVEHIARYCPQALPYLELPPGWRFLLAPGQEEVWLDPQLDASERRPITCEEARLLAEEELARSMLRWGRGAGEFVVLRELTIERPWGWVFFFNSRKFLETRDPAYSLAGNAPYIVNRWTKEVRVTGTAHPSEYYIREYEALLGSAR